jgi:hypothetical protein
MRVLLAIAFIGFAAATARAADLPTGQTYSGAVFAPGERSQMVWLYDDEPGVLVRHYWGAPWHYHHYFPYSGVAPRAGRYENLSAVSHPKPAASYRRGWDNNWAFERVLAAGLPDLAAPGSTVSQDNGSSDARSGTHQQSHAHGRHGHRMH